MKALHILVTVAAAAIACACSRPAQTGTSWSVPEPCDVVMYQVNPRVFAPDNSFKAIDAHLDSIKALGTNVVWFMPICEIGRDEKAKSSPYCVGNYREINPEYGTIEDFKHSIEECHKRGMCVIMDWVANHSSWDNPWITEHPEWYTHNEDGEIIFPEGTDWEDVADFNFDNPEMRQAMIDAMKFWVTEIGLDGFRCDAADFVPFDFWKQCVSAMRAIPGRKVLMLAEGGRKDHFEAGFEINYAWSYMGTLRRVFNSRGHAAAYELFEADAEEYEGIPDGCVKLRFTTNHDETSKMSPIREFHGERGSMAAFVATVFIHGGPLIYSSQEIGYPGSINFFHYVPMDWHANSDLYEEYRTLMGLYNSHPALRKGTINPFPDEHVLTFERETADETILIIDNLFQEYTVMDTPAGWAGRKCTDLMSGKTVTLGKTIAIDPYQYLILK